MKPTIQTQMGSLFLSLTLLGCSGVHMSEAFTHQPSHTWAGIRRQAYNNNEHDGRLPSTSCIFATTTAPRRQSSTRTNRGTLEMRDASASYWFQVGDCVQVVEDVPKAGINLRNRQGKVVETWEKCDVDPTCCCAEQVDLGMAVRVEFEGTESDATVPGVSFLHYFAESELEKVKPEQAETPNVAFDGMSCVAFKLDQLKMGEQAQRLAAFEASRTVNDEE